MSTIKVDTIQTSAGVQVYPVTTWINFDGTGGLSIRADGNVSSLTDVGTGQYNVNFSSAQTDANYVGAGCSGGGSSPRVCGITVFTTSYAKAQTVGTSFANTDFTQTNVMIAR